MQLLLSAAPRCVAADDRACELAALDAALLAWLALEGSTSRARLATLLWPEPGGEAARNSLRQRLFKLHKRVGRELVTGTLTLSLAADVTHDLDDADTLLEGVPIEVGGEFAQWLELQRGRRGARVRGSLAELAQRAEAAKDFDGALTHAGELLALEPLSEEAHRRVMRLHYLRGDRAAALLAFDRCEHVLKHEVGTAPSAETLELLQALQSASLSTPFPRSAQAAVLLRPPRLIGRDAAWQAIAEAGEARQVAVVEGEAGVGKSRLVADYAGQAAPAGLVVSARPGDMAVPYACATRLVRTLVQRCGDPPSTLRRTLSRLLPEWGEPPADDDSREVSRLHAAIAKLLESAAQAGVSLVVFDDLHFADPASAEALAAIAGGDAALQWVITTRPAEGSVAARETLRGWLEGGRARHIVLAALTTAEIAVLVDSLALPGWSGAEMAARLARHTGGNPLFVLETLKSMPADGGATQPGPLPAVASVTELVGRRIGRLSAGAVRIARCAALAGEDFSVELATHLLGAGPLDLADAWAELEAAHVLHEQSFAHDLIRDAARASVPAPLARQLHAQIAQYLERQGGSPPRIAAHWIASPQPQRAVPHLVRAGHEAVKALRRAEAAQWFVDAADLLERGGDRNAAFETLNEYFAWRRSPADALELRLLERLRVLAETPLQQALAAERLAGQLTDRGEFDRAGEVARKALAGFRHEQAPALASALMVQLTSGALQRGQNDEAVRTMSRAVALAETSDDDEAKQNAVGTLGTVLNWAGRCGEAEPHKVRALELAKRLGRPLVTIDAAIELASTHRAAGRMDLASAALEQAEQLARTHDVDIDRRWPWVSLERARVAQALCDYKLAVPRVEEAGRLLGEEMPSWRIAADNLATTIWMALGQWARALRSAQDALARCDGALPMYAAQARGMAIRLDLAMGKGADALDRVDDALARLGAGSARAAQQLLLLRGTLLEPDAAAALAMRVRDEAQGCGLLGVALDAELLAARAARRAAEPAHAAAHARAALALLAQVEPANTYRAEVWLEAACSIEPVDSDAHRRIVHQAARWIRDGAAQRVPSEFRDSFLRRNPVNRDLLALAARLNAR